MTSATRRRDDMKRRRVAATPLSWWTLLTVALAAAVTVAAAQNCSFDAELDRLWCSLRTLTSQNGTTTIPSAARARYGHHNITIKQI